MRRTIAQVIYLDNTATAYPKAPGVASETARCIEEMGGSMSRGSYAAATRNALTALNVRESLCALTGMEDADCCALTPGATWSINMAVLGFLRPGDHVLTSSLEHNAVVRPLSLIGGIKVEAVRCDPSGVTDPAEFARRIRSNTRLAILNHASNVSGVIQPAREIGEICMARGVRFLLDAAQTAGHLDLSVIPADAFALPGHKGLLGPEGIGALVMRREFAEALRPIIAGGTGSRSDSPLQPEFLPDKLEPGTMNLPGIYGLNAALNFILPNRAPIFAHDRALCKRFLTGLSQIRGIIVPGGFDAANRVPVVSVAFERIDNAAAALRLESEYSIMTRCGLHCAPDAHRAYGTYPEGAVRFSIGWANTQEDIDTALRAVEEIAGSC
jgi:cysteine desulfurase family protein